MSNTLPGNFSLDQLTVEYWRKQFSIVRTRFKSMTEIHNLLAAKDPDLYAGMSGYHRLNNIQRNKGTFEFTAKAVIYLEQAKPAPQNRNPTTSRQAGRKSIA